MLILCLVMVTVNFEMKNGLGLCSQFRPIIYVHTYLETVENELVGMEVGGF